MTPKLDKDMPRFNNEAKQPLNRIGNLQKKVRQFNKAEKSK